MQLQKVNPNVINVQPENIKTKNVGKLVINVLLEEQMIKQDNLHVLVVDKELFQKILVKNNVIYVYLDNIKIKHAEKLVINVYVEHTLMLKVLKNAISVMPENMQKV